jgi:DNA-binding CsgD family transcriptional regulator
MLTSGAPNSCSLSKSIPGFPWAADLNQNECLYQTYMIACSQAYLLHNAYTSSTVAYSTPGVRLTPRQYPVLLWMLTPAFVLRWHYAADLHQNQCLYQTYMTACSQAYVLHNAYTSSTVAYWVRLTPRQYPELLWMLTPAFVLRWHYAADLHQNECLYQTYMTAYSQAYLLDNTYTSSTVAYSTPGVRLTPRQYPVLLWMLTPAFVLRLYYAADLHQNQCLYQTYMTACSQAYLLHNAYTSSTVAYWVRLTPRQYPVLLWMLTPAFVLRWHYAADLHQNQCLNQTYMTACSQAYLLHNTYTSSTVAYWVRLTPRQYPVLL